MREREPDEEGEEKKYYRVRISARIKGERARCLILNDKAFEWAGSKVK